eukprot:jgi/Astpho2/7406/fgenesh1_pm.00114_%23_14_t
MQCFHYKTATGNDKDKPRLQKDILSVIFDHNAAPLYKLTCEELGWSTDGEQLGKMEAENKKALEEMDAKIKDAEENFGAVEVKQAYAAKAEYFCKIGDREAAKAAFQLTEEKTAGVGPKMDLAFSLLRLDIAHGDWHAVKQNIEKASRLCEEGGDWERKNRLKVYDALLHLVTRNFKQAGELLLDSIATFGATELMSYEDSIFYTVVTAITTLDRVALKEKVVDAPEILTVIDSIPHLTQYLNALYGCRYADFFAAFADVITRISSDRYLQPHLRYYVREVRVVAYSQFLDSYKSVTLDSMAASFGVSTDFLDRELAEFIVAGRLTAKIDKVAGIVETNRPDAKNAQYQQTIKQGDLLLNRIQRLSKVVDLE